MVVKHSKWECRYNRGIQVYCWHILKIEVLLKYILYRFGAGY